MYVKQTGNWLSFLLSVTIITLPSVSWCESAPPAGAGPPAARRGARSRPAPPRGQQHLHPHLHQEPLHQKLLHQELLHQDHVHQKLLHQQHLHQDHVHQKLLHQKLLHQEPLHQEPLHQQPLHQDHVHQQLLHQQPLHQQPVHQQPVHQKLLHQQLLHQQPLHQQPVHQQPVHQEPLHQQLLHQQPVHQQLLHQQLLHQQPVHQKLLHQQPVHQQPVHLKLLHQEPLHQEPLHQQLLHQQPLHQDHVHLKLLHQEPLHQQPLHLKLLHQQPLHQQDLLQDHVHQQPVHQQLLHQQLLHLLHSSDRTQAADRRPGAGTTSPDHRFRPAPSPSGGPRVSSSSPQAPDEDCATAQIQRTAPGRFYIVGQLEANLPSSGYQADSAAAAVQAEGHQEKVRGQRLSGSEESWQKLQPVVECGDDAMTLVVRRRRAGNLLLDRVNQSSVPLSQLKPQCGYSVQTTWRDLSLMAQYDACHVTQEDDSYVLPLLWRGSPAKMSCPVPQIQPHAPGQYSVCCSPYGMTVTLQGPTPAEELSINVRGEWIPLVALAEQCGFTVESRDAQIVIAAPYLTCGMTVKDGKYSLYLQIGESRLLLSCPVSSLEELPGTRLVDAPPHLSRIRTEPPSEPFPWAAPFYLAPLHYPHPTYQQESGPDAPDVHDPLTPSFSTPDPKVGPQPLPTVDSQYPEYYSHQIPDWDSNNQHAVRVPPSSTHEMEDLSVVRPDLQQKQGPPVWDVSETHSPSSAAASPAQAEAPSLQPPNHAFNPYYHYYHHPKIPLSHPPQDPDAAPEVPENPSPTNTYEFLVWPPKVQQSEATSDPSPPPQDNSHPYIPPSPEVDHKASVSYPYPYPSHYFYYFPHMARGEAKRLTPPHRDMATETNVPDAPPLPESSERPVHEEHNVSPYETEQYRPDWIRNPLLSEDDGVKQELNDEERHSRAAPPALPPGNTPEPDPVPPPHPHLYAPYYHYYQMYSGPEDDRASPTSSKDAADPLLQASSSPAQHQTTSSPTESTYPAQNGHLHPYYYYYHHLYQPEESRDEQEPRPAGSTDQPSAEAESLLPFDSDLSRTDLYAEAGNLRIPQPPHSPVHGLYSQQPLYYAVGPPGGEGAEETLDSDTTDHREAGTPSASPCGLRPASTSNCSRSLGCCSYPVEDCTMGQHFVFVVPDCVLEPTVPPAAHPSEDSEASCVLQRLTSDPEVYVVPLDGCGVNKLMFGQTVVHLLEVRGIYSPPDDRTADNEDSPVRLMVECSSSPGSPGEVRLHVLDQPPSPSPPPPVQSTAATVTVQLRLSTDESFSSFHPEAHLPLSRVRGRPLYLEVSLLEPPEQEEENLVLLVQSCVAHTAAPYTGWMHIYDGCPGRYDSQLLPSPEPHRTRRILISSFLFLPSQSPSHMAAGGFSLLGDPEIFIFCWTEVCSAADGDCTSGCIDSPNGDM